VKWGASTTSGILLMTSTTSYEQMTMSLSMSVASSDTPGNLGMETTGRRALAFSLIRNPRKTSAT